MNDWCVQRDYDRKRTQRAKRTNYHFAVVDYNNKLMGFVKAPDCFEAERMAHNIDNELVVIKNRIW